MKATKVPESNTNQEQRVCKCGTVCKNEKGLRIHQGKAHKREKQQQRTARVVGQAEEVQNPDSNHSVQDHHAVDEGARQVEQRKGRIKWPASSKEIEWKHLEDDLMGILETTMKGNVTERIQTFTKIVYAVSRERFGVIEKKTTENVSKGENRRNKRKEGVRKELKTLSKRWKQASTEEKRALDDLRQQLKKKLKKLRQAEQQRRKRKKHRKGKEQFISNPFKYTADLLGKEKSGRLTCSQKKVEEHLAAVHDDRNRSNPLPDFNNLERPEQPTIEFESGDITLKEVKEVVKKARAKSAPGPSGIPYLVYKKCPRLLYTLWRQLVIIWKKGNIPEEWTRAEGCFVPKEANSSSIDQFRTISLLDVEGKIFFSIIARRLTNYMVKNGYIDTSSQKGGVEGFAGCWEHNSMITKLLQDAKVKRGNITLIWLDLANAYGSVPHELVMLALERYYVPAKLINIIKSYFEKLKFRFTTTDFTTNWQRLEKGIITGCTVSVIVFLAAMNIMIKTAEKECKGPKVNEIQQKPIKAFMDDLTINTVQPQGARWILSKLNELTAWARMSFKPRKCRSLVIIKGKIEKNVKFKLGESNIPTVSEEPVKCLGKWYDGSLRDTENSRKTVQQLQEHLRKLEKAPLPGRYKAWCFQHGVMPRLSWPMLMYDIPMSRVEEMERMASKVLRKWLGVPRSFSAVGLYGKSNMLQLPLSSVKEEYKVSRVR